MNVLAMILAGGSGSGLSVLTAQRAEAAVPFGGKYRIIDFTLSNCVNSGIYNVGVLTQYMPRSLNEHIRAGKPWDLDRSEGGVRLLQPYQSSASDRGGWQEGPSDAMRFNLDIVRETGPAQVLVLAGNHIYKMNYGPMLDWHRHHKADVTIAVLAVPAYQTHRFGMVSTDTDGRITRFEEKPRRTRSTLASMGVYVFEPHVLIDTLTGPGKAHRNLGSETIPWLVRNKRVYSYEFEGYWSNVGTVAAYFEASMGLLADIPALDLADQRWVIHTQSEQRPSVWVGPEAQVQGNLLCDGARIHGAVTRSVLGPGAFVSEGAVVTDSIIMNDAVIGPHAIIDRTIIDKGVVVGENARVGMTVGEGDANIPNSDAPAYLNTGITLIGKGAQVAPGVRLGRNVVIKPFTLAEGDLPSGVTR